MKFTLSTSPLPLRLLLVPLLASSLVLAGCSSSDDGDTMTGDNTATDGSEGTDTGTDGTDTGDGTDTTDGSDGSDTEGDGSEGSESGDADGKVIITTVASDFSSSALEIHNATDPREGVTGLNPGVSDTIVRSYEDKYFVIRRFESDSIAAHSIDNPSSIIFESSTNDGSDTRSGNPNDLVFVNGEKAYLLRYGSPIVWIVNPSAASAAEFKIGEIDLGAYDTVDGIPEAVAGVVVDEKLFVLMQRQERIPQDGGFENFVPNQSGYVAVIDTATDSEIDTGSDGDLKGFELPAINPIDISLDPVTGSIFVAAAGDYGAFDGSRPSALTGGLVTVDTEDYSAAQLIDDTDDTGRITAVEVIDANIAYMITETSFNNATLVKFNPGTGVIDTTGVGGYSDVDLRDIAMGPAGNLWVAIGSTENPQVVVLNPADDSVVGTEISTSLTPTGIAFAR